MRPSNASLFFLLMISHFVRLRFSFDDRLIRLSFLSPSFLFFFFFFSQLFSIFGSTRLGLVDERQGCEENEMNKAKRKKAKRKEKKKISTRRQPTETERHIQHSTSGKVGTLKGVWLCGTSIHTVPIDSLVWGGL